MKQIREAGYVALITVIIVGAVATTAGVALLDTGADAQRSALIELQSKEARNLAAACAEEALQVVHDNIAYSGTNNLSMGLGGCTYTVSVTSGTVRTIIASGTVDNVVRKLQLSVTIGSSSISVTSWQEVT